MCSQVVTSVGCGDACRGWRAADARSCRCRAGSDDADHGQAVAANGEPVNGYQVANRQVSPNLSGCPGPSPAAVGKDIYSCEPAQAAAEVCWPAPATMLCLMDPWSKALRRFATPGALPAVDPPATPMPFALQLDDGTRCILPNGIDWGARADDMVPAYGCNPGKTSVGVLIAPATIPCRRLTGRAGVGRTISENWARVTPRLSLRDGMR